MAIISGMTSLFRAILGAIKSKDSKTICVSESLGLSGAFDIDEFAIWSVISFVGRAVSGCEFKTVINGAEKHGQDWYDWNYSPNLNQCAGDFVMEMVARLLFSGELLIVNVAGQYLIAETFDCEENELYGNTFTNVTRGELRFNRSFGAAEVIYLKSGLPQMSDMVGNLFCTYSQMAESAQSSYSHMGDHKLLVNIDAMARGRNTFETDYNDFVNTQVRTFLSGHNTALTVFDGWKVDSVTRQNARGEVGDVVKLVDDAISRAAQAVGVPPALVRGDIAGVEDLTQNLLTFCVDPLCKRLSQAITRAVYGRENVLNDCYLLIDTCDMQHFDPILDAEKAEKALVNGTQSIDEIRERGGQIPLNTPESRSYWMTKNNQLLTEAAKPGATAEGEGE